METVPYIYIYTCMDNESPINSHLREVRDVLKTFVAFLTLCHIEMMLLERRSRAVL